MTEQTTITERVYGAIPGYNKISQITQALSPYKRAFPSEQPLIEAKEQLSEEIKNILEAGEVVPLDIADGLVEIERKERSAYLRAQVLQGQYAEKHDELQALISAGIPKAYQQLNQELRNIMEDVSAAASELQGVSTAEQAFGAGSAAIEAWGEVSRLTGEYENARRVQSELFNKERHTRVPWLNPDRLANTSLFANFFDIMPYWIEERKQAAKAFDPTNTEAFNYLKWLGDVPTPDERQNVTTGTWPHPDFKTEHLLWASRHTVAWAPSKDQIVEASRAASTLLRTPTDSTLMGQEEARDLYYAITGTTPRVAYTNHFTVSTVEQERLAAIAATAKKQREFDKKLARAREQGECRAAAKKEREMMERGRRL